MRRAWSHTHWGRHGHAPGAAAHAEVNHGRWIVRCPFCPSAAIADHDRFICAECGNSAAGGRYVDVVYPARELASRIIRLLASRPNQENRNWLPGEPAEMLEAENIERDLAV